MVGLGLFIK